MIFASLSAVGTDKRSILPYAIMLAGVLFVYIFGLSALKDYPVSYDEIESLKHTVTRWLEYRYSIPETIHSVSTKSLEHGPLYFVLLNAWQRLAGYDLFSSRLLSVYLAILTVAMVYRLALLTGKREIASTAAIAIACLAYFNYYAHETRMYALLLLLVAWLLWSYWRVVHARGAVGYWRWLSLFLPAASIMYVNYFGFIIIAAVGIYHLLLAPKDRRWLQISLVMAVACLLFAAWLPVALRGFERSQDALDPSRLLPLESLLAMLSIYANGLWLLPLIAAALCLRGQRNRAEDYLLFLTGAVLLLLYALNEATTIMVARRMRYTIVLMIPFCCFLAIGLTRLRGWKMLRFPLLALWVAACFAYFASEAILLYTNRREINHDQVPHYQEFLYEADSLPGENQLIVSFHRDSLVKDYDTLIHYRARLPKSAGIVHVGNDVNGRLVLQGGGAAGSSQSGITERYQGIWVLHNPQQTELAALDSYRDWFSQHYRSCGVWVDKPQAVIAYYLKHEIPCRLVADAQLLTVQYEHGTRLGNLEFAQADDALFVYLWWHATIDKRYSYTVQLFDAAGAKARQVDAVIADSPITISRLDLADLPPGDYQLKLIVYHFETLRSQPGMVLADERRFDRELPLGAVTIAD